MAISVETQIPIVDFKQWFDPSATQAQERLAIARSLLEACQTLGFVYITNHGIPQSTIDEAFSMSAKLFALNHEQKMLAKHPPGYSVHRGYSYVGQENASNIEKDVPDSAAPDDHKETFEIGSEENSSQPNQWLPEDVFPGFREWGTRFYWECARVSEAVLTAIGMGLGLKDPEELLKFHSGHGNQLRLAHYPSIPAGVIDQSQNGAQRCAAHCDFSSLTLLFQDECGGLQVAANAEERTKDGAFIDATPVPGACVVNIGDVLMRWSNDQLKSTMHRVSLPPLSDRMMGANRMTRERFSIPYFVAAEPDTIIKTLPQCVDNAHPAKYEPVRLDAYLMAKLQATYGVEASS